MSGFGCSEVGRLGDDTIEADRVERVVAVMKPELSNDVGSLRDDPEVIIESANIGATTGVKERVELDGSGWAGNWAKVPGNVWESHINVDRHGRRATWVAGVGLETADVDWEMRDRGNLGCWGRIGRIGRRWLLLLLLRGRLGGVHWVRR